MGIAIPTPAALFAEPMPAEWLPTYGTLNHCTAYVPNVDSRYVLTGPFTGPEADIAVAAFEDWNEIRDNAGNALYSSSAVPFGSHDVEVRRVPNGSGSDANCNGLINIDNPILRTFRHEIGHDHGLNHVGPSHDLMTGSDPTMDGCGSGTAIRADDHSNVLYRRSGARVTANGGFENGINLGWSYLNNAGASYTTDPFQGVRSLNIPAGTVVSTQSRLVSSPAVFRARVSYKNFGTNAVYKFEYRAAPHPIGAPACGNAWNPGTIRWDVAPTPGAWTKRLEVALGTTSNWVSRTDAIAVPAGSTNYSTVSPRGLDVKLTFTASDQASLVDNLEVYRG